jgi:hypothetical protein
MTELLVEWGKRNGDSQARFGLFNILSESPFLFLSVIPIRHVILRDSEGSPAFSRNS